MRNRVKENFPTVLLTLLSIVQALALELLWSQLLETDYLFEVTWLGVLCWIQLTATLAGLVLIWVFYASNTMRFRWVPEMSDSLYPFAIGLLEFMLIEFMRPDKIGLWLITMAVIFALMIIISHAIMRQARQDGDNDVFFKDFEPAQLTDFYPHIGAVAALFIAGVYVYFSANTGVFAALSLLIALGVLVWQFLVTVAMWRRSVAE